MSEKALQTAELAAIPLSEARGGWGGDCLQEARETILEVMRGEGGRNSQARLMAARLVLARDFLEEISDEALLAEVRRRAGTT